MIKLSDYVFKFIKEKEIGHVFMLPGGGAMHLVDSLGNSSIEYICCLHEQAASIAAEAYGQHTNDIGVVLTTSGPGATNAVTGVTAAWIDSTPMLVISGQAKREDLIGDSGVRQIGSQEVQIIDIVKPITKYAVQVMEPEKIRYHMERAYYEATHGRPGPVWLSIPLDVQAALVEEEELEGYCPLESTEVDSGAVAEEIVSLLKNAEKPLFLAGNGIKLAGAEEEFYQLLHNLQVPVQTTWKTADMFGEEEMLYVGHPGGMGDRGANFILQEADVLIIIGSRLDSSITAFNEENFGKKAKKVIIDIDRNEINRMKLKQVTASAVCDAKAFIQKLAVRIGKEDFSKEKNRWDVWLNECHKLRNQYPVVTKEHENMEGAVSAYYFIEVLCNNLTQEDVIVPESSGAAGEITYQAFKVKKGQKMKNAAGLGSMGFGLPYSIGACLANHGKRTILINGDGAFQMNIQELQTLQRLKLPVKIFIWNNNGYASIRAMQRNNFNGCYVASGEESGLEMPEICKVAKAYGISTFQAKDNQEMLKVLPKVLAAEGPVLCELFLSPEETVSPRVKTIKLENGNMMSTTLENMWPFLEEN